MGLGIPTELHVAVAASIGGLIEGQNGAGQDRRIAGEALRSRHEPSGCDRPAERGGAAQRQIVGAALDHHAVRAAKASDIAREARIGRLVELDRPRIGDVAKDKIGVSDQRSGLDLRAAGLAVGTRQDQRAEAVLHEGRRPGEFKRDGRSHAGARRRAGTDADYSRPAGILQRNGIAFDTVAVGGKLHPGHADRAGAVPPM
ncbi:hypothetical protein C3941_21420 [Kaistia algarum]|nr:hypothetical protein C3941_21420 [Kaistia algarum]